MSILTKEVEKYADLIMELEMCPDHYSREFAGDRQDVERLAVGAIKTLCAYVDYLECRLTEMKSGKVGDKP